MPLMEREAGRSPSQAMVPVAATQATIDTVLTRGSVCGRGYGNVQQRGNPRSPSSGAAEQPRRILVGHPFDV